MSSKHLVRVGVFCFVGLVGCSGSGDNDGGSGKTDPLPTDGVKEASVVISNVKTGDDKHWSVVAAFTQGRLETQSVDCTTETAGSCSIELCKERSPAPSSEPITFRGAGPISVTGAQFPAERKYYGENTSEERSQTDAVRETTLTWAGGEEIRVAAAGQADGVSAFETTLKAPSFITLMSPKFDEQGANLDSTKDLEVTWSHEGAGSGNAIIYFDQSLTLANAYATQRVTCTYPAGADKGTVPASVLQKMKPYLKAGFGLATRETRIVPAGDWNVEVKLTSNTQTFSIHEVSFQ